MDLVEQWKEAAKRDDVLDMMVPSDIRLLVQEIERLRRELRITEAALISHKAMLRAARGN